MAQMQPSSAMPSFDYDLLVITERKYDKLLREQRYSRQAVGDFEESQRLENLQREKARFKQEMELLAFDCYIRNVYQREREIKEGRERDANRGTPARNGLSRTPLVGHFQSVWQGIPIPRVAAVSVSNVNANGHLIGGSQGPFSQVATTPASNVNISGHRVGEASQTSAATVTPASNDNENGQRVAGSPSSARRLNPEAKAFQSKPSLAGVFATPEACSQRSSEQASTTQVIHEDIPARSEARRDSGYGSSSTSPTKAQSGTSQKVPVETLEGSFAKQQERPAAAQAELIKARQRVTYMPEWGLDNIDETSMKSWVPRILREGYDERYERLQHELEDWEANRTMRATMFANAGIKRT